MINILFLMREQDFIMREQDFIMREQDFNERTRLQNILRADLAKNRKLMGGGRNGRRRNGNTPVSSPYDNFVKNQKNP